MPTDAGILQSWNFMDEYYNHRQELVDLATGVYLLITCDLLKAPPNQTDCHDLYWKFLYRTPLYRQMLNRHQHLPSILRETIAQALARHVIKNNWASISGTPCP